MSAIEIQKALKELGLYSYEVDGINGPRTKTAIKRFQRMNPPLLVDGIAGKNTLVLLFVQSFGSRGEYVRTSNFSIFPHQNDVFKFYGKIGAHQTKAVLPYKMKIAWDLDKTIDRFSCHKKVVEPMQAIFEDTLRHYGLDEIQNLGLDLFGGCLNIRKMRGSNRHSMHSWGIAVDLDPKRNRLKWNHEYANFAKPEYNDFWDIVEKHGATSLGRERDFDWMHFQFARL